MAAVGMLVLAGFPATAVAQSSLTVATGNASTVTEDGATLHGNLTDLGHSDNASVWFTYWKADDPGNTTQSTSSRLLNETGSFNDSVSGLSANTTYEFQAHAEGSSGNTSTGAIVSFTTAEFEPPTVRTDAASNVTSNSATLAGNLTDLGDSVNASVWFRYWKAADPANSTDTAMMTVNETGAFNRSVTGLAANTTYEFQAYAEGSTGQVANGSVVSFTTGTDEADGLSIGVKQGAARVTISVTDAENATAVAGANVSVTSSDTYNGTGDYVTGDDGTVSIPAPDGNRTVTVTITAEADGKTGEVTVTLRGTEGQGPAETPFGMRISSFIKSLKGLGVDGPLGQVISSFAKANNPGADNKPDHAGGRDAALDMLFGDDDDGNETDDRGPPEDAGPGDGNETETEDDGPQAKNNGNGQGPPDHAQNKGNESDGGDDAEGDSEDEAGDSEDGEEDDSEDEEEDDSDDEAGGEEDDSDESADGDESNDNGEAGQGNGNGNGNAGGNGGGNGNGNAGGNGNGQGKGN